MTDTVIRVENLGKKYIIDHQQQERYSTLRDAIANRARAFTQKPLKYFAQNNAQSGREEFWALKDVSFEIKQGERVGIIGRNGAGKSTLLKVLSRITEPTSGRISIKGRVASLLEVGTGFHPELTGRENIYLNGAILGMSKVEIKRKFDEIVAFAEVEKFLDTPVKRYSSGMYVRLAFAVAAHLEPEILIVDEVLAVGDAQFQKKCLGKMEDVGKEGRTVLFVSHNMGVIKSLCISAILLSQGNMVMKDETSKVVDAYLTDPTDSRSANGEIYWLNKNMAPGGEEMRLISMRLLGSGNLVQGRFDAEQAIKIEIVYEIFEVVRGMRLIIQMLNSEGIVAFSSTDHAFRDEKTLPGLYCTFCTIPANILNSGIYFIRLHVGCPGIKVLVKGEEFLELWIEKTIHHGSSFSEKWPGIVAPKLHWKTQSFQTKQ